MFIAPESRCEICGTSRNLEVHHIHPKRMGGTKRPEIEAPSNKATLCRSCHSQITEQRWQLERTDRQLLVRDVTTGEVVLRRLFDPDFSPSQYFQELNLLEPRLEALLQGIPYLSDDQLVELFQSVRGLGKEAWKLEAAVMWEAKRRSVYGDRAWEAMGRTFGIGWRQAYNLAKVWEVFFLGEEGGFCTQVQDCSLEEVTWYVVSSRTDAPHFWLGYAEDQKAQNPSYSITDFKADLAIAGQCKEDPVSSRASPCQWLQMYCVRKGEPVSREVCRTCSLY